MFPEEDVEDYIKKEEIRKEDGEKKGDFNFKGKTNKDLDNKMKKIKKEMEKMEIERVEGSINEVDQKERMIIIEEEEGEKKKVFLTEKALFVKTYLEENTFKVIGKEEITIKEITEGNSVVSFVFLEEERKALKCLLMEKIVVL